MPLTPEDVRNKRFTPVRLREGYDMGEVDQFLDEVEAELERLTIENEELRAKVAAASSGEPTGLISRKTEPKAEEPKVVEEPKVEEKVEEKVEVAAAAPAAAPAPSIGEASSAAARLLEIASTNADQLMEAAKDEADRIVGEAKVKAERLETESKTNAEKVETEARVRAQKLDEETTERRETALAQIEKERTEMQREVEHLRAYEREYRARLKNYFQSQLDQLNSNESEAPANNDQTPKRVRSMLANDEV